MHQLIINVYAYRVSETYICHDNIYGTYVWQKHRATSKSGKNARTNSLDFWEMVRNKASVCLVQICAQAHTHTTCVWHTTAKAHTNTHQRDVRPQKCRTMPPQLRTATICTTIYVSLFASVDCCCVRFGGKIIFGCTQLRVRSHDRNVHRKINHLICTIVHDFCHIHTSSRDRRACYRLHMYMHMQTHTQTRRHMF